MYIGWCLTQNYVQLKFRNNFEHKHCQNLYKPKAFFILESIISKDHVCNATCKSIVEMYLA